MAKMSGRGLGFTGGTVDKLESIQGYRTNIDMNTFVQNVEEIGISMISQTLNLAPADKKIYALRDSISCVESIPLIASSIMSKKIASGAEKIVIDVTVGSGAFMKNLQDAKELANEMIKIGELADRETVCVLTNMDEPLGISVGNNLEVIEAVEALKGNMPEDVKEVVLELGANMMKLAGKGNNIDENKEILMENILNGKAFNKFLELVEKQGGNIEYLKDTSKFERAKYVEKIYSLEEGYIRSINAKEIGRLVCNLGAGRIRKEDEIDNTVGVKIKKKVGDYVKKGEEIAEIFVNEENLVLQAQKRILEIFKYSREKVEKMKTIISIIS